jgi:hypothetical protein
MALNDAHMNGVMNLGTVAGDGGVFVRELPAIVSD